VRTTSSDQRATTSERRSTSEERELGAGSDERELGTGNDELDRGSAEQTSRVNLALGFVAHTYPVVPRSSFLVPRSSFIARYSTLDVQSSSFVDLSSLLEEKLV